jgi:predicted acyl esterase
MPQRRISRLRSGRGGLTFLTPPLPTETEITGPAAAKLFVSSSTVDADLFLALRVFTPDLKEVVFQGALEPHALMTPGEVVELDVEICLCCHFCMRLEG